jgi:hypothetical protein
MLVAHIKEMENGFNHRYDHNIVGHPKQLDMVKTVTARMREYVKDDKLFKSTLACPLKFAIIAKLSIRHCTRFSCKL